MMFFRELIDFRKKLSIHHLIYSNFSSGWQIVLVYLIWLYLGVFAFLLFYFRSVTLMPVYAGLGLAPVLLWGWALRKKVKQVALNEYNIEEEDWDQTGLDSVREKKLDIFLRKHNQNHSAVVLNMATMVYRDSTAPSYRLNSPTLFASLFVALGAATISWLIGQGTTVDEVFQFLWNVTGILLAIAITVGVIEWMISQALREHRTYLRRALLKALNDCYFLYSTQEREQEILKRKHSSWFKKLWK